MIFDIKKGIACKVPLSKLVLMNSDLHPYFSVLLVADLCKVGDAIRVLKKGNVIELTEVEFESFLENKGA